MSLYIYVNIKETYKHDILWHFKFAIIVMFQIPFDPVNVIISKSVYSSYISLC